MKFLVIMFVLLAACAHRQRSMSDIRLVGDPHFRNLQLAVGQQRRVLASVCSTRGLGDLSEEFRAAGYIVQVADNIPADDYIGPYAIRFHKADVTGDVYGVMEITGDNVQCYDVLIRVQKGVARQPWRWTFGSPIAVACHVLPEANTNSMKPPRTFSNLIWDLSHVPSFAPDRRFLELPSDYECPKPAEALAPQEDRR
jgi:hypothetical protein